MAKLDEESGNETSKLIQTKNKDRRALVGLGVVVGLALVTAASIFIGADGAGSKVTSLSGIPRLKGPLLPPKHHDLYNYDVSIIKTTFAHNVDTGEVGPTCPHAHYYDRSGTYTTTEKACEKGNNEEIKPVGITGTCDDGWHLSNEYMIETPACADECPVNYEKAGGENWDTAKVYAHTCEPSHNMRSLMEGFKTLLGGDNPFGIGAQCTCMNGKAVRPPGVEIKNGKAVGLGLTKPGVFGCFGDNANTESCATCDKGYKKSEYKYKHGTSVGCCKPYYHLEIDDGFDLFDNYSKRKCVPNKCKCRFGNPVDDKDCLKHGGNQCKECVNVAGIPWTDPNKDGCCPCNIQCNHDHSSTGCPCEDKENKCS